jgi:hypothetical protein
MFMKKNKITKDEFLKLIWLFVAPIKNKAVWEVMRTDSEQVGIEAQTEIKTQTEASSPN